MRNEVMLPEGYVLRRLKNPVPTNKPNEVIFTDCDSGLKIILHLDSFPRAQQAKLLIGIARKKITKLTIAIPEDCIVTEKEAKS